MILGTAKKEDESYANANCTHRCMCGSNAAVVCLYFNEGQYARPLALLSRISTDNDVPFPLLSVLL